MSLLDSGQVATLYPDVDGTDGDGNAVRRPGADSVQVVGRWQYLPSIEDASEGQSLTSQATFLCRSFPAGFAGRVTYDGRDWDVAGEPIKSGLTSLTTHWKVRLRARSPREV